MLNAMNIGVQLLDAGEVLRRAADCQRLHGQARQQAAQYPAAGEHLLDSEDAAAGHPHSLRRLHLHGTNIPHLLEQDSHRCRIASPGDPLPVERKGSIGATKPAVKPLNLHRLPPVTWRWGVIYALELLPGPSPASKVTVLDSQCCGIAGTYGFKSGTTTPARPSARGLQFRSDKPAQARSGHHRLRDLQVADRE